MNNEIAKIAKKSLQNDPISHDDAFFLMQLKDDEAYDLYYWANKIRLHFFGSFIKACSIVSAKQGGCTEDCRFCSQSVYYNTDVEEFQLIEANRVLSASKYAKQAGSSSIGIVTSGYTVSQNGDFEKICNAIKAVSANSGIHPHGSFGVLTKDQAECLVNCGLKRINHNLETSERFFPNVCTTHTYADRVNTIHVAKQAGLEICSGAIFGIGEEIEDRIILAFTLKNLDVDVVPLNFLHPISGTPMEKLTPLAPVELLKIISVFRFILPDKDIKIAGGREKNLRSLQSWVFYAGANSLMIGNYLTTKGNQMNEDLQMIRDLGLEMTH